jgi:hypothetical protein
MSHRNDIQDCPGCLAQFNKYPGFYQPLQNWFFSIRKNNMNFHVACAGRGKIDQESAFARGASNAHYGQSSHNCNAAIDTFFQIDGQYRLDENLFDQVVQNLDQSVEWYGKPDAVYKERPHFEWSIWRDLLSRGILKLVE